MGILQGLIERKRTNGGWREWAGNGGNGRWRWSAGSGAGVVDMPATVQYRTLVTNYRTVYGRGVSE